MELDTGHGKQGTQKEEVEPESPSQARLPLLDGAGAGEGEEPSLFAPAPHLTTVRVVVVAFIDTKTAAPQEDLLCVMMIVCLYV